MRDGYLNKDELKQVARCYSTLDDLLAKLPAHEGRSNSEQSTAQCLVDARNRCGEILAWQDFGGLHAQVVKPRMDARKAKASPITGPVTYPLPVEHLGSMGD